MVFPSLMFNLEPGTASQFTGFAVIAFSFILHRIRKIALLAVILLSGFLLYQSKAHAFAAYPTQYYNNYGPYQNYTMNNLNYYGHPYGHVPPVYFYPQLQFHTLWGPQQPYYFNPHPVSPYSPNYNCPMCIQNQAPVFPYPNIHPGGAAS